MKIKTRTKASSSIPSSSMSDIAFLLIIFFMLTTVFSQEAGLKYELPDSIKEVSLDQKNIEIFIDAAGVVSIGETAVSLEEVKTTVKTTKMVQPDIFVVIKVNPKTPYRFLVDTIDSVLLGGVDNIAFQSSEESYEDFDYSQEIGPQ